jgi:hypothetical protein
VVKGEVGEVRGVQGQEAVGREASGQGGGVSSRPRKERSINHARLSPITGSVTFLSLVAYVLVA